MHKSKDSWALSSAVAGAADFQGPNPGRILQLQRRASITRFSHIDQERADDELLRLGRK